jgi:enoyl-CoA hydratase/carnithine racemase
MHRRKLTAFCFLFFFVASLIGLVQPVSSPGQALKEAIELARLIATKSPSAVRAVKQAINSGYDLPLEEGLKVEKGELFRVLMTNEYKGRIDRFFDK